jgi:hypothetical protein
MKAKTAKQPQSEPARLRVPEPQSVARKLDRLAETQRKKLPHIVRSRAELGAGISKAVLEQSFDNLSKRLARRRAEEKRHLTDAVRARKLDQLAEAQAKIKKTERPAAGGEVGSKNCGGQRTAGRPARQPTATAGHPAIVRGVQQINRGLPGRGKLGSKN